MALDPSATINLIQLLLHSIETDGERLQAIQFTCKYCGKNLRSSIHEVTTEVCHCMNDE